MSNYGTKDVEKIQMAYNTIFPDIGKLTDYLDLKPVPSRKWSCLTTDFSKINYHTLSRFEKEIDAIENSGITCPTQLGREYKKLSDKYSMDKNYKVGFSIGISTWTDYLLNEYFDEKKKEIVIFLGHDWYPIMTDLSSKRKDDFEEKHPLLPNNKCLKNNYQISFPDTILDSKNCLFMNLYPDFRPPASATTGKCLRFSEYSYFVEGFENLCKAINPKFTIAGVISWGKHVWEAMRGKVMLDDQNSDNPRWKSTGIMKAVEMHKGCSLTLFDTLKLRYYPFAHPSDHRNFKHIYADSGNSHCEYYQEALSNI